MSTTTSERAVVNGVKKQLFIGGEWRDATEGETLTVCRRRCRAGALVHPSVPHKPPGRRRLGPAHAAGHARRGLRGLLRGGPGC